MYDDVVSLHAVERYRERVEPVSPTTAYERLSTNIIRLAIKLGCPSVKLPSGHSAIIRDGKVTTVLPKARAKRYKRGKYDRHSE